MSRRRWFVLVVVVALVGGGGGAAYALTRGSSSSATGSTTTTVTVSTGTVQSTVVTTGTIEPKQDEDLTFGVGGTVTSVAVTVGQKVEKGAVLATVDSTTLRSAVTTAQASVTAAEEQLSSVSSSSSTQEAAAEAQLASAKTDLANAEDNLAKASLTAPFAGTVAEVGLTVGDVVGSQSGQGGSGNNASNSSSSASSSSSITLISTDAWIVNASVGSSDLAQLKKGMQAQITPSGAAQRVFGTVSSIGIVASSSSTGSSATFPVVIDVTGSPTGLYAGGSSDVTIIVKQLSDVLTVPTLAVSTVDGQTVVYRRVNGKRVKTLVTLGDSYGSSTVVTKGLSNGDVIELTFTRPTGQRRTGTGTTNRGGFNGGGFNGGGFNGGGFNGGGFVRGGGNG